MAQILHSFFSWLHTTAVGYDYESFASSLDEDFSLVRSKTPTLPPVDPLPNLAWDAVPTLQRIKQDPLVTVQGPKEHPAPIIRKIRTHPSRKPFVKRATKNRFAAAPSPKLGSLQGELKLAIMQRQTSLHAPNQLVSSPKSIHGIRSEHPTEILPIFLQNELRLILFEETYWVSRAGQRNLSQSDYARYLTSFVNGWADCKPGSTHSTKVPLSSLVKMSPLYHKITFVVRDFCYWSMEDSVSLRRMQGSCILPPKSEALRITRAFHHLGLFCTSCVRDYIYVRRAVVFARTQLAASVNPFKVVLHHPWDGIPETVPSGTVYLASDPNPIAVWDKEDFDCGTDLSPRGHYFRELSVMIPAKKPTDVSEAPHGRKIARAISPKAKMLRLQQVTLQKSGCSIAGLKKTEGKVSNECPTPGLMLAQAHTPTTSDHGSTSSGWGLSIRFGTSSTTSGELSTSTIRSSSSTASSSLPPKRTVRLLQSRSAKGSPSPEAVDQGTDKTTDSDSTSAENNARRQLYSKEPSDVAAWIEQSGPRPMCRIGSLTPPSSEHDSGKPTKQQRKKANRKARKAAREEAIQQAREMEVEQARREEARKEHQKVKRERKKRMEKGKGEGNGKTKSQTRKQGPREATNPPPPKGKERKERKTVGYFIG